MQEDGKSDGFASVVNADFRNNAATRIDSAVPSTIANVAYEVFRR
jgi:hypothetical protein